MKFNIKPNLLAKLSNDELIKIMIVMKTTYDKELDEIREKYIEQERIYESCVERLFGASEKAHMCSKCNLWFEEEYHGFVCEECNLPFCEDCEEYIESECKCKNCINECDHDSDSD
jgi:hypothetical protein